MDFSMYFTYFTIFDSNNQIHDNALKFRATKQKSIIWLIAKSVAKTVNHFKWQYLDILSLIPFSITHSVIIWLDLGLVDKKRKINNNNNEKLQSVEKVAIRLWLYLSASSNEFI